MKTVAGMNSFVAVTLGMVVLMLAIANVAFHPWAPDPVRILYNRAGLPDPSTGIKTCGSPSP
jgi:hypothetical protein